MYSRRRLRRLASEWPTLLVIVACYGLWVGAGVWLYPVSHLGAMVAMAVVIAFHASLQHEAIHGHPTGHAWIDEALVGLPIGLIYPYRRYRRLHLRHHADQHLTEPDHDPESFYHDPRQWKRMPRPVRALLHANNTFAGRLVIGPWLGSVRFATSDLRCLRRGQPNVGADWCIHLLSLVPVVVIVAYGFHMPFWQYVVGPVYGGTALAAIRSYCEHRWHEDVSARTIIVERSWLGWLFLNNNLHVVHHARPGLAWFRLPRAYRIDRERWQQMNGGYVYRGYAEIARRYLWRRKEPLPHPAGGTTRGA